MSVFLLKIKAGKSVRWNISKTLCPKQQSPDSLSPGTSVYLCHTNIISHCTDVLADREQ